MLILNPESCALCGSLKKEVQSRCVEYNRTCYEICPARYSEYKMVLNKNITKRFSLRSIIEWFKPTPFDALWKSCGARQEVVICSRCGYRRES